MKIKKGIYFSLLVLSSLLFSCEKDKDPLAACRLDPTCEYFTCKVNGVRWEPQCDGRPLFGCSPWDVQYYRKTSGNIEMQINKENKGQNFAFLTRNQKLRIGENKLHIDESFGTFFSNGRDNGCNIFILDTITDYSFNIVKIDTFNYYLMGIFYLTCKNNCGEQVQITEGEFNLSYTF